MKLSINGNLLRIKLNLLEIFLTLRISLNIPLDHIRLVSTDKPKNNWAQVCFPGTHIPLWIKSGTFHGRNNKEFWQTTAGIPYLVIELMDWDYNRIVLTMSDNKMWAERINALARSPIVRR